MLIFLLGKVCQDFLKIGVEKIRKQTSLKANIIYNFFDNHKIYKPAVQVKNLRSETTIVIDVKKNSSKIINFLKTKKIYVASGYGNFKNSQIRIANFPAHTIYDVKKLLSHFARISL